MNQKYNTILSFIFLFFITLAISYLALQKYMDEYHRNLSHEQFVENKLADIQEQLQALQEYQQAQDEALDALNALEAFLDNQSSEHEAVKIIDINTQDHLRSVLQKNNQPAVIFFHMDGCGWCKKMTPVFEQAAQQQQFSAFQFYNVDGRSSQAPTVVKELYNESINGYPFFLFIDQNGIVGKQSGFAEQDKFENAIKGSFKSLFPNFVMNAVKNQQPASSCGQRKQEVTEKNSAPKPDNVIEITTQNDLRSILQKNNQPAAIFFHMDGCGWCKKMTPVFYASADNKDFENVQFYTVDGRLSQAPMVVKELYNESINGYPFLLFIDQNGFVDKQSGFLDQENFNKKITSMLLPV